ncbi:nitronate monooxygenase [Bradyrhizobium sp. ISRA443]|uniref:NAD(P)H-dependent flavin oxidoreductase n=1 Tax=unclassified Bradyrhizobium TaxID=2631580 RepID=UPI002479C097|nr:MULTISPECIES: nitronate monooxygenase [unclassified Bradyrhizobium]WGR91808.1 nitronate monooxygenase [Bradyrhizobium sp. ISRA435]WGS02174.1 nitronate monooxygenase [Bradyrhizobium sp. ISRA436]WGS09059.1 nitronate monooxygenase [Bradyrhizobium sp. ISRA437]WGS15948.1 nitronate monooxygenase [Bradyrhizobium sp. ISRA443]
MPISTELTARLGIQHPVLLAPMDTISGSGLVRAVSEAGGFGILGGGYGDRDRLAGETAKLKDFARPFGIGFITWSLAKRPELLDIALEARPHAVMLSFGDPAPFAPSIKAAGALLICQVQAEDMARQALDCGADVLIAQGTEAGGHGASRTTIDIVPAIVDLAAGRVPVVAAGGIADGRGLAAMLMLGASGVLMGTRFYASIEADGADEAKRRICAARSGETVRGVVFDWSRKLMWPSPFSARSLSNDHLRRWTGREIDLMQRADQIAAEYAEAKAVGNFDVAAVFAGESVGLIHDIPPAAEIVGRIVAEAEQSLQGRRNSLPSPLVGEDGADKVRAG